MVRITRTFLVLSLVVFLANCSEENKSDSMAKPQAVSGELTYQVPEGWVAENPSSRMRKAQFRIPGTSADMAAEMAVFYFPKSGGSVQANLDRWYGQFVQPDGSVTREKAMIETREVNDLKVTTVYFTGTYMKSSAPMMGGKKEELPGYAMWGAIVEGKGAPWFFKATGPQSTIDGSKADFEKFIGTFKF
jgi:hypothetical protein